MDKAVAEEEEEKFNEWVFIQTSPKSLPVDASTSQNSPIYQTSYHRENQPEEDDDDDDDDDGDGDGDGDGDEDNDVDDAYDDDSVSVVEEESESSSTVELSLPLTVIETAKKRLVVFFTSVEKVRCNYVTHRRVFWSLTFIASLSLVSSLVYVKLVRWWRRLHEEKLRFLLLLLREKDQKIKELMVEIGRLNELVSSRRKVRVVRIV